MIQLRCLPRRRRYNVLIVVLLLLAAFYFTSVSIFHLLENNLKQKDQATQNQKAFQRADEPLQPPQSVEDDGPTWKRKPYSPNAVLKMGVLGNYEPQLDMDRRGPGEYGEPVYDDPTEKEAIDQSCQEYGFNMVNGEKISLDRIVKDIRLEECKYWHYPEKLPTASVILVFNNEGWSVLVRTIHSVINMSPKHLLKEVILVDDGSDKEHVRSRLEQHIEQFGDRVKLFRNQFREGLIRSRIIGAAAASGDVIVFLDAHCECSPNWLPPLLARIAYDRTIMAAPIVDGIDWTTYEYRSSYGSAHFRGIFEWGLFYKEIEVPKKELGKRQHHSEPYWSPTNAGGLFAMDRKFFYEVGGYDPHIELWGGENFELAFKIWQCGGSSEWVPCSRVGHLYRHCSPQRKSRHKPTKLSQTLINYLRVVEVWMDDKHKEYFYTREPQTRGYPIDITSDLEFKKSHKCKNFSWFMDNVAYDVYYRFPPLPPNKAWGRIWSKKTNGTKCLDFTVRHGDKTAVGTYTCRHSYTIFRLSTKGQIGYGERCIMAAPDDVIVEAWCSTTNLNGPWDWNEETGLIHNKDRDMCVTLEEDHHVKLTPCDKTALNQQWGITELYPWKE